MKLTPSHRAHLRSRRIPALTLLLGMTLQSACGVPDDQKEDSSLSGDLSSEHLSWNNRMRTILAALSKSIPVAGNGVSAVILAFWPADNIDIWSLIEKQVSELIDEKILSFEIRDRMQTLEGLRSTMQRYMAARNNEKASLLSSMIQASDALASKLMDTGNPNKHHLLPLVAAFSHLHLNLLRERALFGRELYQEDNSEVWQSELKTAIAQYQTFIAETYNVWRQWRLDQIVIKRGNFETPSVMPPFFIYNSEAKIKDAVSRQTYVYEKRFAKDHHFGDYPELTKRRIFNEANARLILHLAPAFNLGRYAIGQEGSAPAAPAAMQEIEFGPYSHDIKVAKRNNFAPSTFNDICDEGGALQKMDIRFHNSIDALQFHYESGAGKAHGNLNGGSLASFGTAGNPVTQIETLWSTSLDGKSVLTAIGFTQADGETTPAMGNKGNWKVSSEKTTAIEGYQLAGLCSRKAGYSGVAALDVVSFRFRFHGE